MNSGTKKLIFLNFLYLKNLRLYHSLTWEKNSRWILVKFFPQDTFWLSKPQRCGSWPHTACNKPQTCLWPRISQLMVIKHQNAAWSTTLDSHTKFPLFTPWWQQLCARSHYNSAFPVTSSIFCVWRQDTKIRARLLTAILFHEIQ